MDETAVLIWQYIIGWFYNRSDYTVISESDSAHLGSSSQLIPLTHNSVQFKQVHKYVMYTTNHLREKTSWIFTDFC